MIYKHNKTMKLIQTNYIRHKQNENNLADIGVKEEDVRALLVKGYLNVNAFHMKDWKRYLTVFQDTSINPFTELGMDFLNKNGYQRFREKLFVQILVDLFSVFGFIAGIIYTISKISEKTSKIINL